MTDTKVDILLKCFTLISVGRMVVCEHLFCNVLMANHFLCSCTRNSLCVLMIWTASVIINELLYISIIIVF